MHSAQENDSKSLGPAIDEALNLLPAVWKVYVDRGYRGDAVQQLEDMHIQVVVPEARSAGCVKSIVRVYSLTFVRTHGPPGVGD